MIAMQEIKTVSCMTLAIIASHEILLALMPASMLSVMHDHRRREFQRAASANRRSAVHLAAWLHEQGHRVTLADCDTQQSSSEWIREAVPEVRPFASTIPT